MRNGRLTLIPLLAAATLAGCGSGTNQTRAGHPSGSRPAASDGAAYIGGGAAVSAAGSEARGTAGSSHQPAVGSASGSTRASSGAKTSSGSQRDGGSAGEPASGSTQHGSRGTGGSSAKAPLVPLPPSVARKLRLPHGVTVAKTKITPRLREVFKHANAREAEVAQTLKDYIRLLDEHNPRVCTEYLDANFLHATTGKTGDAAVQRCRQTISRSRLSLKLVQIEGVRLTATYALIQFLSSMGNRAAREIFRMAYINGRYVIDGVAFTPKR